MVALLFVHLTVLSPRHPGRQLSSCCHLVLTRPVREIAGWWSYQQLAAGVQTWGSRVPKHVHSPSCITSLFIRTGGLPRRSRRSTLQFVGSFYPLRGLGPGVAEALRGAGSMRRTESKTRVLPWPSLCAVKLGWQVNSGIPLKCSPVLLLPRKLPTEGPQVGVPRTASLTALCQDMDSRTEVSHLGFNPHPPRRR